GGPRRAGGGGPARPCPGLRGRGAVADLQRHRDVGGRRSALDRQGADADTAPRDRCRRDRRADIRAGPRNPARGGRHGGQRGLPAMSALLVAAILLVGLTGPVSALAQSGRERALDDLARSTDVAVRRAAVQQLADTGVMADLPALATALRDPDPLVRGFV